MDDQANSLLRARSNRAERRASERALMLGMTAKLRIRRPRGSLRRLESELREAKSMYARGVAPGGKLRYDVIIASLESEVKNIIAEM